MQEVENQLSLFRRGIKPIRLVRPATVGDGILRILPESEPTLLNAYTVALTAGRLSKFVPASGAASRMFQSLVKVYHLLLDCSIEQLEQCLAIPAEDLQFTRTFLDGLPGLAIRQELERVAEEHGYTVDRLLADRLHRQILKYLLTEQYLNYCHLPKGMIPFHCTAERYHTPFDEQLAEAAETVVDGNGVVRIHFTLPEDGGEEVKRFVEERLGALTRHGIHFELTFSRQSVATNTIVVDDLCNPVRDSTGNLQFRPAGHGALLKNLTETNGDIVMLKNIDNVQPVSKRGDTIHYKKLLAGLLVGLQAELFDHIRKLSGDSSAHQISETFRFATERLNIRLPDQFFDLPQDEQRSLLLDRMNRPIRVCGMVPNQGEPGGGPFWVLGEDDCESLQIVEGAQVDLKNHSQRVIWHSSTHFNPVDLVCGLRGHNGQPFDLKQFVNPESGLITTKSKDGQAVKALELPGLWNGSMAGWITLFVEVPITTFTPVKTINDLLRPEHKPV